MTIQSKTVPCAYCNGTGKGSTPLRSVGEELAAAEENCAACSGNGTMEIRKTETSGWSSKCLTCDGKGFTDAWDYQREQHETPDCLDCNGAGGIPYATLER